MEYRVITKAMELFPYQHLFFTTLEYEVLHPVFQKTKSTISLSELSDKNILLLTGIASPRQMVEDLSPVVKSITPMTFADHHNFKRKDIEKLNEVYASMPSPKLIVTTEKDAARLITCENLSEEVKKNLYHLPIRINFMLDQEELFNENIIGYVRKNSRNSILAKAKDDHKPQDSNYPGNRPRTISFRNK